MLNRDYHRSAAPVVLVKEATGVVASVTCINEHEGCSASETWRIVTRCPPPEILKKHFERKGWQLKRGPLCELCQAKKRKPTMATKPAKPANDSPLNITNGLAMAIAQQGAAASDGARKALRLAIQFLEDYFDDGRGNYKPGWSDARIAEETGASEVAVKAKREELFGPLREPDEVRALRDELTQAGLEQVQLAARVRDLSAKFDRLCSRQGWVA